MKVILIILLAIAIFFCLVLISSCMLSGRISQAEYRREREQLAKEAEQEELENGQ